MELLIRYRRCHTSCPDSGVGTSELGGLVELLKLQTLLLVFQKTVERYCRPDADDDHHDEGPCQGQSGLERFEVDGLEKIEST